MQTVYPQGTAKVVIPAGEKIAIKTADVAQVLRLLGYPQVPNTLSRLADVVNQQTVYGVYASGATIVINAGAAPVFFEVGVAPIVQTLVEQPAPSAKTVAVTLTAAELLTKIITGTHTVGATQAYTLPTGADVDLASEFVTDFAFTWVLINLSAAAIDTITLTAATGHTIVGNPIVQSAHVTTGGITGNSAQFRTRKTAADTFVTYRVA